MSKQLRIEPGDTIAVDVFVIKANGKAYPRVEHQRMLVTEDDYEAGFVRVEAIRVLHRALNALDRRLR